jgi:diguanylate cyclase (GGDEF)-like protein
MNLENIVAAEHFAVQKTQGMRALLEKGESVFQSVHLRKDKSTVPVEVHNRLITLNGQKIVVNITLDITERKQAEEKLKQAFDTLTHINSQLEDHNTSNIILSEMTEWLQSCSTLQEIPSIITGTKNKLFPESDGALFLLNKSRTEVQSVVRWGNFPEDTDENNFTPDSCWGLRRGKTYMVENPKSEPVCAHLKQVPACAYTCLPLIAKGDTLGLLHLRDNQATQEKHRTISEMKEIATKFVEYLSLSIANIKLRESLTTQSFKDPLTGLFNRRYMEEALVRELSRAERSRTKLNIVMMDIDHFKQFNDTFGHEAGDELLVKLAEFFKVKIRQTDVFCRFGGEEFILILPESTADGTFKRLDQLREEIKSLSIYFRNKQLPAIALSMGIATYPDHGINSNDLIQIADKALYRAKQEGRDRIIIGVI